MKFATCPDCKEIKNLTIHHLLDRVSAREFAAEILSNYKDNDWSRFDGRAGSLRFAMGRIKICRECHDMRHNVFPERTRLGWTRWEDNKFIVDYEDYSVNGKSTRLIHE